MKFLPIIAAAFLLCLNFSATAKPLWSSSNVQFLASSEYDNLNDGSFSGELITIEHAAAYDWGKTFAFIDRFKDTDSNSFDETYAEINADFSLSHWSETDLSSHYLKDVYLATQWEYSNVNGLNNYLIGVGTSWNIEGFTFLNANLYHRNNTSNSYFSNGPAKGNNYQLTIAWSYPFNLGDTQWFFDGFIDVESPAFYAASGKKVGLIKFQPQLKLDIGHLYDAPGKYLVGVEFDYFRNKFGVEGANQFAPQLMLQIIF